MGKSTKSSTRNLAYTAVIILCFILSIPLIIFNKLLIYEKSALILEESTKNSIRKLLFDQTKYLAISKYGISRGHTDQADIYFNAYGTKHEISSSKAFILGNSRSQLGLSGRLFEYMERSGLKLYHLGNGCGESIEFGLDIISKYRVDPKVLIINADYKFTGPRSICTLDIINQPDTIYNKYLTSREKNKLVLSLFLDQVSVLDYLYRNLLLDVSKSKGGFNSFDTVADVIFKTGNPGTKWFPIEFRDIKTGMWERVLEQALPEKLKLDSPKVFTSDSCSLSSQESRDINNKIQQIQIKYPAVKIIFIYIPYGTLTTLPTQAPYCSKRLELIKQNIILFKNVYFFEPPSGSSYYAYDHSHLASKSAELYTKQLIEWMQKTKVLSK